jgi:hypothetical protein
MKIALDYPVSARGKTTEGGSVRAFGYKTGEFEIPEATVDDCPILIEFRSGQQSVPVQRYRHDPRTGQVFRAVGTVGNATRTRSLTRAYDGLLSFNDLFEVLRKEHESTARAGKTVLPEFSPLLTFLISRHPFDQHPIAEAKQADLGKSREEAQAALSRYLVVKGMIWEPCGEPMLKVARGNQAWGMGLGLNNYFSADWQTYYFSIDEFEQANQWIDTLDAEVKQRPRANASMNIDDSYRVVLRGGVEDILQLGRYTMMKVVRAGANLADQSVDVITTYAQLKRLLETPADDLTDIVVDEIASAINYLCEADENELIIYAEHSMGASREPRLRQLRPAVDLHIRRWQDRPINILTAKSAHLPR